MIWFGFGTAKLSPAKATPGTIVTIDGQRLGSQPGTVVIKGSGQVTLIEPHRVEVTASTLRIEPVERHAEGGQDDGDVVELTQDGDEPGHEVDR